VRAVAYHGDTTVYSDWSATKSVTFGSGSSSSSESSVSGMTGQVNTHGGSVNGLTTSYVCNGGSYAVKHHVQNTWHITAKNVCYSYGITWYECWDTDDGDYYGWIDSTYIDFY